MSEFDGRWLALGAASVLAIGSRLTGRGSRAEVKDEELRSYLSRMQRDVGKASPTERASVVAGQLTISGSPAPDRRALRSKVRQAYRWISTEAIIVPYHDMIFAPASLVKKDVPPLTDAESYSAFVLMPFLTLLTARRALLLGGPGRGKTTSALVLAIMSGMSKEELRQSIVRGHPQLMVSDLLGQALPSSLVAAKKLADIDVTWRSWISRRVKIIDEYNRIPTKTQSALLSLMSEGYAEMYDKYITTGRSSWFLTANDDLGGGTFQVIEALKDRIDVVVRAAPFSPAFADKLMDRMQQGATPEELVPQDLVFTKQELDAIYEDILKVTIPAEVLDEVGFLMGALEFCRLASPVFEYKTKDTLKLSGVTKGGMEVLAAATVGKLCTECKLDKKTNLCTQTENGISTRALQSLLHYAKAMAWFRGKSVVTMEEIRVLMPWILHDKLVPNVQSGFFKDVKDNASLLRDRVAWLENLVVMSSAAFQRHKSMRAKVKKILEAARTAPWETNVAPRMAEIKAMWDELVRNYQLNQDQGGELSGYVYDSLTSLQMTYGRYAEIQRAEQGSGNKKATNKKRK
jgi:MoxR-like ATPase